MITFDSFNFDAKQASRKRGIDQGGKVQKYIDSQVLRLSNPYIPKRSSALIRSGTANTNIGSGLVSYQTPYARKWYYTPANFFESPMRGNYWFEKMKRYHRKAIENGMKNL